MKIILITDYFYPLSNGGTEKYVYLLAKHLAKEYEVRILSIHQESKKDIFSNLIIDYIPANTDNSTAVISGLRPPNNIKIFEDYLNEQQPDIVHFHTLTTNFNQHHTKISNDLGIKTFFTSHIPGHQCLRGDFMYHGKKPCDGKVEKRKCIKCVTLYNKKPALQRISKYLYYNLKCNDPVNTKLLQLKAIEESTEKIIAVCNWQKEFLIKNGINDKNLSICRQEVSSREIIKIKSTDTLRLGFIGRIDPVKGLDLLINALKAINYENVQLTIAAIKPSLEHQSYFSEILETSKEIACEWHYDLKENQIVEFFKNVDYLVIPSLGYETGPFVGYEALACNTSIVATNFGGQFELVDEGRNGYLFEPKVESLITLIKRLLEIPVLLPSIGPALNEENIAIRMKPNYSSKS